MRRKRPRVQHFFRRFRVNTRFQYFVSMVFHNFRRGFHVSFLFSAKHDSVLHCAERPRKTLCRSFVAAARGAAPDPADILKMSAKRLAREPRKRGPFAICYRLTSDVRHCARTSRETPSADESRSADWTDMSNGSRAVFGRGSRDHASQFPMRPRDRPESPANSARVRPFSKRSCCKVMSEPIIKPKTKRIN